MEQTPVGAKWFSPGSLLSITAGRFTFGKTDISYRIRDRDIVKEMVSFLAGVALMAVSHPPFAQQSKKDWLWWKPRVQHSTRAERLGLTRDQLLDLGYAGWDKRVNRKPDLFRSKIRPSLAAGNIEDAAKTIYGVCLRQRNDEIIAREPKQAQLRFKRLRSNLFRFGMTCIALEAELNSGGTTQLHAPSRCFVEVEGILYPHRIQWNIGNKLPIDLAAIRTAIDYNAPTSPATSGTSERELQRWKERAFGVLANLDRDLGPLHSTDRRVRTEFLMRWVDHINQ